MVKRLGQPLCGVYLPPRERSLQSLERKQHSPSPRERVLILCSRSALGYFSDLSLCLQLTDCVSLAEGPSRDPLGMVDIAAEMCLQAGFYRRLYVLADLGAHPRDCEDVYFQAKSRVRGHDLPGNVIFRLLFSVPDFLLWLQIHYENPSGLATIDLKELELRLEQLIPFGYVHNHSLFENTRSHLTEALSRSRALVAADRSSMGTNLRSFTEIHELVVYLLRLHDRMIVT